MISMSNVTGYSTKNLELDEAIKQARLFILKPDYAEDYYNLGVQA